MKTISKNARNKREEKKEINIKWNSRLFFQISIIASLLLVFFIMQTKFEITSMASEPPTSDFLEEPPIIEYVIDVEKPKPMEPTKQVSENREPVKRKVITTIFEAEPNNSPTTETPIATEEGPAIETPIAPVTPEKPPVVATPHNIINVEFVPVFPGCESLGSNVEKVDCMSSKINSFINKNFRKELLENLGSNEIHRIYVNFKIDSKGFVTDVTASSNYPKLKKEAQRVINDLPKMKPGKQGDKSVDVLYTVPIVFKIQ